MGLSSELISQFVKATKDDPSAKTETVVYGTAKVDKENGASLVQLDGSTISTPVNSTVDVEDGDRVIVMIKNHTATVTGNLTSPSARVKHVELIEEQISTSVTTDILNARLATVNELIATKVSTDIFNARVANVDNLLANKVDTGTLTANLATINQALIDKLDAYTASIMYAKITDLTSVNGKISTLESDVADIDTLIFGSATGSTIQTSFANAVIAQLGNAQIKSAMIDSVSADKITAGDIITNDVRVMSEDGRLIISDETVQISDSSRVRVQIGKDASNDYSINIWDENGNLMFSKGGITDSAIKQAIIRNDMVSDTANIAAHKLDIDSLFDEINGSSKTIKSTKVYLDDKKQTLDVAFTELTTDVTELGETVTSHGTQISVIQGRISSKIWQQDINTATDTMSTKYSTLEQSLNAFKTSVGDTYATKSEFNTQVTTIESSITQLSNRLTANVTETTSLGTRMSTVEQTADGLSVELENLEIGGRNILLNTGFKNVTDSDNFTFSASMRSLTCTSSELGKTYSLNRTISDYGLNRLRGNKITMSGEYKIESAVTYGTTNPWLGMELSVIRTDSTGGSSQWVAWLGSKSISDTTVTGKWVKVSKTYTITDYDFSAARLSIILRDFTGSVSFRNLKIEFGNKATDWSPAPEDFDNDILAASKTATNYLSFSSTGLVIGDMTASTLGKNILIDSDSVDIRSGTDIRASFGEDYLYLAKHSRNAKIDLCNGLATLYHQSKYSYDTLFVIDTPNATEIMGTYNPLYVTSTVTGKVAIQFSNVDGTLGSIGMVASGTGAYITRNVPSTTATYSVLDTGNFYSLMDSGWLTCTINTSGKFTIYDNDSNIRYRKIGKMVEVVGTIKPKEALDAGTTNYVFGTLPSGYRPSLAITERCQGSGGYSWLFSITTGGELRYSRYSNGSTCVVLPAATWLPFHATFFTD